MKKTIFFAIREYGEIRALKVIDDYCKKCGFSVIWKILPFSFNSDLSLCNLKLVFKKSDNFSVFQEPIEGLPLSMMNIFGFKTDIAHPLDEYIQSVIDVYEINACRMYKHSTPKESKTVRRPRVVVGNVRIEPSLAEFEAKVLKNFSKVPYDIIVIPRHPLAQKDLGSFQAFENIELRNTMGELEDQYASAQLTVMGKIFSGFSENKGDHNPIEATANSNTICGMCPDIPSVYKEYYEISGLTHRFADYNEIFNQMERLINDPNLPKKLEWRDKWIGNNRDKYLKKAIHAIGLPQKL